MNHLSGIPRGAARAHSLAATLRWADAAAERRDYAEALHWLRTVTSAGNRLSPEYAVKRSAWTVGGHDDRAHPRRATAARGSS